MAPIVTPAGLIGSLERHTDFRSAYVAARHVDVWLPPAYGRAEAGRFPVLYMHDGQNVFDPDTSYTGVDWGIEEALGRLIQSGQAEPVIVVAIWNTPDRVMEYLPRKPLLLPQAARLQRLAPDLTPDDVLSDRYLTFLVDELKPFVDARYRTRSEPEHTFVMGSSMGGLISL